VIVYTSIAKNEFFSMHLPTYIRNWYLCW